MSITESERMRFAEQEQTDAAIEHLERLIVRMLRSWEGSDGCHGISADDYKEATRIAIDLHSRGVEP